jgi:uncharacterized membrane protein
METSNTIVGVYDTHHAAIAALKALKESGLPVENISFISKADIIEGKLHANISDNEANVPVEIGVVLGPVLGILSGLSIIAIPGLGFLYGAGALIGAFIGFDFGLIGGGITTMLIKLGINKDKAATYQEHLEKGKYIITISGTDEIVEKAKATLHTLGLHIDLQHHK